MEVGQINGATLVSHVGRRDSYELAFALSSMGIKVHLVTDYYYLPGTISGRLMKLFQGARVYKRHRVGLDVTVHSSAILLALDFFERIVPRNKYINRARGRALGRVCKKVIAQYNLKSAYFYTNSGLSSVYNAKNIRSCNLVLFQMHPHPQALRDLYESYCSSRPAAAKHLRSQEEECTLDGLYFKLLCDEPHIANGVICTSSYVRSTLLRAGVDGRKILLRPYGARLDRSIPISKALKPGFAPAAQSRVKLAFVGQFVVRKGVFELAEFVGQSDFVELVIFTRDYSFAEKQIIRFIGNVPDNVSIETLHNDSELWMRASQCDFLILPSLAEGFGLVITEAMAVGLPVIATKNSIAGDIVESGKNGFLMDSPTIEAIERAVTLALKYQKEWHSMRMCARERAESMSWESFQGGIQNYHSIHVDVAK